SDRLTAILAQMPKSRSSKGSTPEIEQDFTCIPVGRSPCWRLALKEGATRSVSASCRLQGFSFAPISTHEETTMLLARILASRLGSSRRRSRKLMKNPPTHRLLLEQLEDRITPATQTFSATFGPQATNFTLMQAISQFNPSQGQLNEVDISFNGSVTST